MFKKIIPFIVLAAVSFALVLPAGLSAGEIQKIRIKVDKANVRQSALLSAPVIIGAVKGQIFTVVEKAGDWYLVQIPNGGTGYIHSSVVEEVVEGETIQEEVAPPAAKAPARAPVARQQPLKGDTFSMFLARIGYFLASDSAYTDVYQNGLIYGGELRIGGKNIAGWVEGNYRAETGELTYTLEETKVSVFAVEGGALYRFSLEKINPYLGAGVGFYMFNENNTAIGEAKKSSIGFCVVGGASMFLGTSFVVDARVKYSTCSMKPADFDINIGGITVGLGVGIRF